MAVLTTFHFNDKKIKNKNIIYMVLIFTGDMKDARHGMAPLLLQV